MTTFIAVSGEISSIYYNVFVSLYENVHFAVWEGTFIIQIQMALLLSKLFDIKVQRQGYKQQQGEKPVRTYGPLGRTQPYIISLLGYCDNKVELVDGANTLSWKTRQSQ